ncbi:MAG: polyhydroxyalkanoate synthesis regulator DNA-binding domain-containing protein [Deltaproteobacteria bacterium]|nr:polyhydroxyalkanoate synthesis regulator DNA-binding domain-containing protein [Deltaproteobacteria bacterium]
MAEAKQIRVIKRYANRKLYDTRDSKYITLDRIAEFVRNGEEVKVIDNRSKAGAKERKRHGLVGAKSSRLHPARAREASFLAERRPCGQARGARRGVWGGGIQCRGRTRPRLARERHCSREAASGRSAPASDSNRGTGNQSAPGLPKRRVA